MHVVLLGVPVGHLGDDLGAVVACPAILERLELALVVVAAGLVELLVGDVFVAARLYRGQVEVLSFFGLKLELHRGVCVP